MNELLNNISLDIERYCIAKGCSKGLGFRTVSPQDIPATFGVARHVANEAGCTHFAVIAPGAHAAGYFFSQFRCRVMEFHINAVTETAQADCTLEQVRKRRVTIVVDALDIRLLPTVVEALQQHDPAELWVFVSGRVPSNVFDEIPSSITRMFTPDQVFCVTNDGQLEKDLSELFARMAPRPQKKCDVETVRSVATASVMSICDTLKPLFRILQQRYHARVDHEHDRFLHHLRSLVRTGPRCIADSETYRLFLSNIFRPGSLSIISAHPELMLSLSLMLLVKYSNGSRRTSQRHESLLVSLAHPVDVAERLITHFMGRDTSSIMRGEIEEWDWPQLARAASEAHGLGIGFWQEGMGFDDGTFSRIILSAQTVFSGITLPEQPGYGLVVINDAIGQLSDCIGAPVPVDWLARLKSTAVARNIPVILVCTDLTHKLVGTDLFDYGLVLKDGRTCHELLFVRPDSAMPVLRFSQPGLHSILEEMPTNFSSRKPSNYDQPP